MKPEVWKTDSPTVVYMVPASEPERYAAVMNQLTSIAERSLERIPGTIDLIGLISADQRNGIENMLFLEEIGVDTRLLTLIVLWADTADAVNFDGYVSEECGVGKVILTRTGVVLPAIRMPSIDNDWWLDRSNQEFAATAYVSLVHGGKGVLSDSVPYVFVAESYAWN